MLPVDRVEHAAPGLTDGLARRRRVERGQVQAGERLGELDDPGRVLVAGRAQAASEATRDQDVGAGEDAARIALLLERDSTLVEALRQSVEARLERPAGRIGHGRGRSLGGHPMTVDLDRSRGNAIPTAEAAELG